MLPPKSSRPVRPGPVSYDEALEIVLEEVGRLGVERRSVERCAGRVLAEDVRAATAVPAFAHSAMDGYALAAKDLRGRSPWTLSIAGESRAGHPTPSFTRGTACRVFSGAQLPAGADTVVKQEDVDRRDGEIVLSQRPPVGQYVRARGSDLAEGAVALRRGCRLSPGRLGLAAHLDRPYLEVARRPVVAIASTGDELRLPGEPHRPASIVESNSLVISTIARQVGADVRVGPLVRDDAESTETALRRAFRASDVVVTIGGSSVGAHDWVRPSLEQLGVRLEFRGVAMRPGKPTSFGRTASHWVLCLPGNPAAATLAFLLLGAPLLRALQGDRDALPRPVPLRVLGAHVKKPGYTEFLRARLEAHDGELCAVLHPSQSAGAVTGFAEAQALVVAAADRKRVRNGDRLPVFVLRDLRAGD